MPFYHFEMRVVARARHAVFGTGGDHETGKPAQVPQFRGRHFGFRIFDTAYRTAPMVRLPNDVP
jgi:hypothetical protein